MLQWIRWYLNGLKVVGIKGGQRPKKFSFLIFGQILKI